MVNFQLGFPYAREESIYRNSIVLLRSSKYRGFREIENQKDSETYHLQSKKGSSILDGFEHGGVVGTLFESENGKSIARDGEIHGDGSSMQLALVLAACSKDRYVDPSKEKPFILFSAKIIKPSGSPNFIDAKITTYCTDEEARESILSKYEAAVELGAKALVVPKRDATILGKLKNKKFFGIDKIKKIREDDEETYIISAKENELPDLAKILGISPYYFKEKNRGINNPILFFAVVITFCLGYIYLGGYLPKFFITNTSSKAKKNINEATSSSEMDSENIKERMEKKKEKLLNSRSNNSKIFRVKSGTTSILNGKDYKFDTVHIEKSGTLLITYPCSFVVKNLYLKEETKIIYKQPNNLERPSILYMQISNGMSILGCLYIDGSGEMEDQPGGNMKLRIDHLNPKAVIKMVSEGSNGKFGGNGGNIEFYASVENGKRNEVLKNISVSSEGGMGKNGSQGKKGLNKVVVESLDKQKSENDKILKMVDLKDN